MEISKETEYWLNLNSYEEARDKVMTGDWKKTTKQHLEILKKLDIQSTDVVLEFGCGVGRLMKPLKDKCKLMVGTDISDKVLSYAMSFVDYGANFKSLKDEVGQGLPIEFADKIFSIIVMQHIEKPKVVRALVRLNNCLKPGGSMLIQFPNLEKLKDMYSNYMLSKYSFGALEPRMEFYTRKELEYIFEMLKMNFAIEEIGTDFYVTAFKQQNIMPQEYMLEGDRWKK